MRADAAEDLGEGGGVVIGERREEEAVDGPNVAGEHGCEDVATGGGEGGDCAALVVRRRRAGDEAALLEELRLIGESAAAVDHAVGEVGHPLAAVGGIAQAGQQLELDVAEVACVAELPLDGRAEQGAHLREGEVGGELGRSQGGGALGRHVARVLVATSSKQC